ncbi:hypothetical protein ACTXJ1_09890 [Brachybacterium alimentarium]|uniref:hypothetical protein n=1 Tax=Brachybacterium alimentarium TaxID=47845 RepID=UPI003FCFDEF2
MHRINRRPLVTLGAVSLIAALSACSGASEGLGNDGADPSERAQQQVSPEQWYAENCPSTVAKVTRFDGKPIQEGDPVYALIAGRGTVPQDGRDEGLRLYSYDQAQNSFTALRAVEQGEEFCFDSSVETTEGYSQPLDDDVEFAPVASPEYPDGVWIDHGANPIPLDSNGKLFPNAHWSAGDEFYWGTTGVPSEDLESATETIDDCEFGGCGG